MPHDKTFVESLPNCDLCHAEKRPATPAEYDGKTVLGPWAFMCEAHFQEFGTGLGLGKGQRLIVQKGEPRE